MKKRFILYVVIPVFLFMFVVMSLPEPTEQIEVCKIQPNVMTTDMDYDAVNCVTHRNKEGEILMRECGSNVLYNTGANMTMDMLGSGTGGAVTNMSLCNATAGCDTPVAGATETYNEIFACNLSSATGTETINAGNGNRTITYMWTSTCDGVEVNATRLNNGTDLFAGNSFTLATMQTGDTLENQWNRKIS